jgi:hypothetical protein
VHFWSIPSTLSAFAMTELIHIPSKGSFSGGREELEYAAEEDMRMVSGAPIPILPGIQGYNHHFQLLDNFAISSVDPNYAYINCGVRGEGNQIRCVNLKTGEYRTCGRLWKIPGGVHALCCGFGYVAVVTSSMIYIAEESNWNHYWSRQGLGSMINSCVITKLLQGEDGQAEEVVLIVGSNGGAITTLAIPTVPEPEYMIMDQHDSMFGKDIDQTDVPEGKVRVLKFVETKPIEVKQHLCRTGPAKTFPRINNINCIAQGKGMYTDYIVAAPDYESRLLIFVRQYEYSEVGFLQENAGFYHTQPVEDAKLSIFELIEQQRNPSSILLPLAPPVDSKAPESPASNSKVVDLSYYEEEDSDSDSFGGHSRVPKVNSLNLAWAPWHHRSIVAAGTDSNQLIIYDFDAAQALLAENSPDHIFDETESVQTILYHRKFTHPVRLLKFSPLPSVPILAVAVMTARVYFIDCNDWSIEWVSIPSTVTGMTWTRDASALLVATSEGCVSIRVKKLPSLTDQLILQLSQSSAAIKELPSDLEGIEDIKERMNLASFGYVLRDSIDTLPQTQGSEIDQSDSDEEAGSSETQPEFKRKRKRRVKTPFTVSWDDEEWVNPPQRLKSGPPPTNGQMTNRVMVPNPFVANNEDDPVAQLVGRPDPMGHVFGNVGGIFLGNIGPRLHFPRPQPQAPLVDDLDDSDSDDSDSEDIFTDGPEPTED